MIAQIIVVGFTVLFLVLSYIDYKKKREIKNYPFVSFIMPSYNDEKSVVGTIKSIYKVCKDIKFEIIAVNDGSSDSTLEKLKEFSRKSNFILINNEKNIGKVRSMNKAFKKTTGEVIFIIDSDLVLGEAAFKDIISRLQDKDVGAVSCRYVPSNKGFFPLMQELEYNIMGVFLGALNYFSCLSIWGGCSAIKREAFVKAGMFSENMLTEDIELALKLNRLGYKVEQSFYPAYTDTPTKFKQWFKQKIRWTSGGAQAFYRHPDIFARNPISFAFFMTNAVMFGIITYHIFGSLSNIEDTLGLYKMIIDLGIAPLTALQYLVFYFAKDFASVLIGMSYFSLYLIPYAIMNMRSVFRVDKLLLVIPFSIIYSPLITVVSIIGFTIGIYKGMFMKEEERGW